MERVEGDLEIKVISARHLWAFNFFQKLCVYATASLWSKEERQQEQRTATDGDGDGHPEWNHPMSFRLSDVPSPDDFFLRFELRHHAGLPFPDRTIGEVKVPLSDLLDPSEGFRFVDYQIRSSDDKPNGVLHFGYKLNRIGAHSPAISGYPQMQKPPPNLYPASDMALYPPTATHEYPSPPPLYRPPPPPAFMYPHPPPPPPPPPPGYFPYPWTYRQNQYNNGR